MVNENMKIYSENPFENASDIVNVNKNEVGSQDIEGKNVSELFKIINTLPEKDKEEVIDFIGTSFWKVEEKIGELT